MILHHQAGHLIVALASEAISADARANLRALFSKNAGNVTDDAWIGFLEVGEEANQHCRAAIQRFLEDRNYYRLAESLDRFIAATNGQWPDAPWAIDTVTLWRPVGPTELDLIRKTGMRAFPPRHTEQPIFYPVLSKAYAAKIARDWNVRASGAGYVTRFRVQRNFLVDYEVREAGGRGHLEYWIPAADLDAFNAAIVGELEVIAEFR